VYGLAFIVDAEWFSEPNRDGDGGYDGVVRNDEAHQSESGVCVLAGVVKPAGLADYFDQALPRPKTPLALDRDARLDLCTRGFRGSAGVRWRIEQQRRRRSSSRELQSHGHWQLFFREGCAESQHDADTGSAVGSAGTYTAGSLQLPRSSVTT